MSTTYNLPERNAYLYPHDPDNPDNPPPYIAGFHADIRAIDHAGGIWITIANLTLRIDISGDTINLSTYPLHLEALGPWNHLSYGIDSLEKERHEYAHNIERWTGEPYEPYIPPPRA